MKRLREEKERLEMEISQQELERRARELDRLRQEQKVYLHKTFTMRIFAFSSLLFLFGCCNY
jgi:hypothetical protein